MIRSEPFAAALPLRRLERHPLSAQAFLPLAVGDYLVVVAPDAGGRPDEASLRAFRVPAGTGIVYRSGAWHAHMTTMAEPGTFAMLVHEDGSPGDCVFASIAPVTPEG
ncbi:ureidoglycolate lyase [Methylobacterium terricola]|uniref:ureidoglycolate lyase n=1 Tax=Methylobacterium terricola TaxID=2583531 RepID=UPI00319D9564